MFSFSAIFGPYSILETAWYGRNTVFTCSWSTREYPRYRRSQQSAGRGRRRPPLTASFPLMELVTELRRRLLQCGDQIMGSRRNCASFPVYDLLRIGGLTVELVIGFIVGAKR